VSDAPSIRSVGATKLHCEAVSLISAKALNWVENNFITPNLFVHFDCWTEEVKPVKLKRGYMFIWHATIWTIWRARNNIIFNNGVAEIVDLIEKIKVFVMALESF